MKKYSFPYCELMLCKTQLEVYNQKHFGRSLNTE